MMYYIKNNIIIIKENKKDININIEADYIINSDIENWIFKNWEIVEATNVELFTLEKEKINNIFESKIKDFLVDYPDSEIATFETKRNEANKYIETWESYYIETLAATKKIDPLELSKIIQEKSLNYINFYCIQEEEKNIKIKELKEKYNFIF